MPECSDARRRRKIGVAKIIRMRLVAHCVIAIELIFAVARFAAAGQAAIGAADSSLRSGEKRRLANAAEIYHELKLAPGVETAVARYFPSFREYQELMLYHPAFGYYSSGRVNFVGDYQTFPNALAPYFGQLVALQIFRMWDGMRQAGTLRRDDRFTIAEIGAGDGVLAESILDYLSEQKRHNSDPRWQEFGSQVTYVCYDRAPALTELQRRRNARFGSQFEANSSDATNLNAAIPPGSLKGVILSNELLDVFGVHKVILSESGSAEVAFVAPFLSQKAWNQIRSRVPLAVRENIGSDDRAINNALFAGRHQTVTYLSRDTLVALLESITASKDYFSLVQSIAFQEIYLPVHVIPELAEHLQRYAHTYASELASRAKGIVTYVNLGAEKFIRGAGAALSAGYVITIDYGSSWDGIMAPDQPHLRTYGPGPQRSVSSDLLLSLTLDRTEAGRQSSTYDVSPQWDKIADINSLATAARGKPDPYRWPTLNDITSDVNFSQLAIEGRLTGLRTLYFGPQRALRAAQSISLTAKNPTSSPNREKDLNAWLTEFARDGKFKLLIEQKQGTDDAYVYPDNHPETLDLDESRLNVAQRRKVIEAEHNLHGIK